MQNLEFDTRNEQYMDIMSATAKTSATLMEFIAHATQLASLQCVGSFPPTGQGNVQPQVSSFRLQASSLKLTNCSTNFRSPFFQWHCDMRCHCVLRKGNPPFRNQTICGIILYYSACSAPKSFIPPIAWRRKLRTTRKKMIFFLCASRQKA